MPNMSRASRATLRSSSGPQAAAWLTAMPTSPATTLSPVLFQISLRRRTRLPLLLSNRRCEGSRARLVDLGDHRAACSVLGRLRRRAKPIELAGPAIFPKEGAVVGDQVLLRDNTKPVDSRDSRPLDFVACPNCGDTPVVSPLHRDGTPHLLTPDMDGASFSRAVAHEEATYLELIRQNQYGELAVLARETEGRWHHRAFRKVSQLIEVKTQTIALIVARSRPRGE